MARNTQPKTSANAATENMEASVPTDVSVVTNVEKPVQTPIATARASKQIIEEKVV